MIVAPRSVHQISGVKGSMFFPRCRCGWEGVFMLKSEEALSEGYKHHREVK